MHVIGDDVEYRHYGDAVCPLTQSHVQRHHGRSDGCQRAILRYTVAGLDGNAVQLRSVEISQRPDIGAGLELALGQRLAQALDDRLRAGTPSMPASICAAWRRRLAICSR